VVTKVSGPTVLWVVAEAVPWASTGGLGDVAGSLPAVLRQKGWDVRVCLPLHRVTRVHRLSAPVASFQVFAGRGRSFNCAVREALEPPYGVPTAFIDCELFDRAGVYADGGEVYPDNAFRFGVFQLAVRAWLERWDTPPAILHCHDWHAALLPALVKTPGQWPEKLADIRTILTIHNLLYQGHAERELLDELGLPTSLWHPEWLEHLAGINFLKGGILSADLVTTVSRTYASEIRTPDKGLGLDGPLRDRSEDLFGIVNGIDDSYDPASDPAIAANFSAANRAGKAEAKKALRAEMGLSGSADELLIGFVGRLTDQKGVDLLLDARPAIADLGAKVVALGNGEKAFEEALLEADRESPQQFRTVPRYDPSAARRIFAGVDVLVVPSRMEPCGLVQLYAQRYGALPVAHAVGGLADTITDGETGFLFSRPTAASLAQALKRAQDVFRDGRRWDAMVEKAMRRDWSWHASASGYDALYKRVLEREPRVRPRPTPPDDQAYLVDYGPDLPRQLGAPFLHVLVQGPRSLYVFWERPEGEENLTLVLEEQPTAIAFSLARGAGPVGDFWTPALPDCAYQARLLGPGGHIVAVSNVVLTPRDRPVVDGESAADWWLGLVSEGALDDPMLGDRWRDLFPQPLRPIEGARRWDGGIGDEPLGQHTPGSEPPIGPQRPPRVTTPLALEGRPGVTLSRAEVLGVRAAATAASSKDSPR
jgi:starch synthase